MSLPCRSPSFRRLAAVNALSPKPVNNQCFAANVTPAKSDVVTTLSPPPLFLSPVPRTPALPNRALGPGSSTKRRSNTRTRLVHAQCLSMEQRLKSPPQTLTGIIAQTIMGTTKNQ